MIIGKKPCIMAKESLFQTDCINGIKPQWQSLVKKKERWLDLRSKKGDFNESQEQALHFYGEIFDP